MSQSYTRRINIWINGQEVQKNIHSIRAAMRQLINEQSRMTIGSKEYNEHGRKIAQLQGIMNRHKASIRATGLSWQSVTNWIGRYRRLLIMTIASMAAGGLSIRKAVQDFNDLEESIANLSAITGLAGKEMDWLADQAKKMSTSVDENGIRIAQSAKEILDAFALIGSQRPELLKDKEALVQVTQAALTLAAAGKIELQSAARAVTGVMNQMNLSAEESVRIINVLGAGSQAGAGNIEYLNTVLERTGTTARNINIPFEQLIGTIEAVAPKFTSAEEASTQLRNVLLRLASGADQTNPKIVGLQTALENLAKEELSIAELRERFGRANVNMAATLIENRSEVDRYTAAETGSNIAIEQAITNTSTNSVKLQQARNELQLVSIALGQKLSPAITGGIRSLAEFLKFTQKVVETTWKYRSVLVVAGSGLLTYSVAVKTVTVATAAYALVLKTAKGLQTGFNLLLTKNPIGLVLSGITMLVIGLQQYSSKLRQTKQELQELSREEKARAEISQEQTRRTGEEIASLDLLIEKLRSANTTNDQRSKLIYELNRNYGHYLGNLVSEQASLTDIQAAYDGIVQAIRRKIEFEVKSEKAKETYAELFELREQFEEQASKLRPGVLRALHGPDWTWDDALPDLSARIRDTEKLYNSLIGEITSKPLIFTTDPEEAGEGGSPEKWSLSRDQDFIRQSLQLKQDHHNGIIQSEREYQQMVLALEIQFLEARLAKQVDTADDLLTLQHQLADKRIQAHRAEQQHIEALQKEAESPVEKENREYRERLVALGLFGRDYRSMTAQEQAALEAITQGHKDRLAAIAADQLTEEINERQLAHETALSDLRLNQARELESFLGTADQRKALTESHQQAEREMIRRHLEQTLADLAELMESGTLAELDLAELLLSEETRAKLQDMINKVKSDLAGLLPGQSGSETAGELRGQYFDIFGFTQDDWDQLFKNIKNGKIEVEELQMAVVALGNLWHDANRLIAQQEQKKMADFEKNNQQQKDQLQERLEAGLISHEVYTQAIANLDNNLNRQRARYARQQAIRERNVAMMMAVVNAAAAVVKALVTGPVLAAIVGLAGAMQIGIIASTPIPEIPGAQTGGFLDVVRAQDKRRFRGRFEPDRRGWITRPTVITGESGHEYVIPDEGVRNPKLRPLINLIEMARVSGSLPTLDPSLPGLFAKRIPGRQTGGSLSGSSSLGSPSVQLAGSGEIETLIRENKEAMDSMTENLRLLRIRLQEPIQADVSLLGNRGLLAKQTELDQLKKNAYS